VGGLIAHAPEQVAPDAELSAPLVCKIKEAAKTSAFGT
jgi:hypothetical protein